MQPANQKPEKLDMLSQHAVETNHRLGKLDMLSQHKQCRHAIPAYTAKINLHKRGYKSPEQWTSRHSKIAVQLEEPEQEKQHSKQLQHLERLGKRHETASVELGTRRPINRL